MSRVKIKNPNGFSIDEINEIARKSLANWYAEQILIWGDCHGSINNDIVRHVLMVAQQLKQDRKNQHEQNN